jgi:hypothetical protein
VATIETDAPGARISLTHPSAACPERSRRPALASPLSLLLASSFVSGFGTSLTQMYSALHVYGLTGSNFAASLLASLMFGAGVVSSLAFLRLRRHLDLIATMWSCEALCALILCVLVLSYHHLLAVYLGVAAISLAAALFTPCFQSALHTFSNDGADARAVNSAAVATRNAALGLGWLAAPVLFRRLEFRGLLLIDGTTYLASAALILALRHHLRPPRVGSTRDLALSKTGRAMGNSVRQNRGILALAALVSVIFAAITALEIGTFRSVYHMGDAAIGVLFVLWIVGGAIGGPIYARLTAGLNGARTLLLPFATMVAAAAWFPLAGTTWLAAVSFTATGVCYAAFTILFDSYVHQHVEATNQPRVFSARHAIFNCVMLGTMPLCGHFADVIGIAPTMLTAIGVCAIVGALLGPAITHRMQEHSERTGA